MTKLPGATSNEIRGLATTNRFVTPATMKLMLPGRPAGQPLPTTRRALWRHRTITMSAQPYRMR
jgi:hypothetical protein